VFFCDVSQQVLFAQHPGSHAFSLGAFDSMHGTAESRIGATKSAIASVTDMLILLSITPFYSTIRAERRTDWSHPSPSSQHLQRKRQC
jgi:hypothetical protein